MVLKPGYRPGELGGYDGSRPRFQSVSKVPPTATKNGSLIAIFSPSLPLRKKWQITLVGCAGDSRLL